MLVNFVDIFSIPVNFKTCNPVKFDSNVETCFLLDSKKKHQLSKNTTLFRPKKRASGQQSSCCQLFSTSFQTNSNSQFPTIWGRTRRATGPDAFRGTMDQSLIAGRQSWQPDRCFVEGCFPVGVDRPGDQTRLTSWLFSVGEKKEYLRVPTSYWRTWAKAKICWLVAVWLWLFEQAPSKWSQDPKKHQQNWTWSYLRRQNQNPGSWSVELYIYTYIFIRAKKSVPSGFRYTLWQRERSFMFFPKSSVVLLEFWFL